MKQGITEGSKEETKERESKKDRGKFLTIGETQGGKTVKTNKCFEKTILVL